VNIFIGNLPFGITGDELKRLLSVFGEVKSVIIMHDGSANTQETGLYSYIEMNQKSEGMAAIKCLNGITLKGRTICVIEALPLSPRKIESSTREWNAGLSKVRK
jgi:RNA recognition motif-containing protein